MSTFNLSEEEKSEIRKQHEDAAKKFRQKQSDDKQGLKKIEKKEDLKKEEKKK